MEQQSNRTRGCKIVFLGLFAGVNLILLDDVSESILIPSSGQSGKVGALQTYFMGETT